jgi:hypothetical protein
MTPGKPLLIGHFENINDLLLNANGNTPDTKFLERVLARAFYLDMNT